MPFIAPKSDGYLIDLDGTLVTGGRPIDGAARLLDAVAGRFAIVSNDAEHTPDGLARALETAGLRVPPDRLVLAGAVAIETLARSRPNARVMVLASPALQAYAEALGLRLSSRASDVVLVGRDRAFSYDRLGAAARDVAAGAELWVSCPDGSHRGPDGEPVPEAGALGTAISAVSGIAAHRVIGKPHPLLFEIGCGRLNLTPKQVVVIGDNPSTDGAGAAGLGIPFVMVRPGELGSGS